MERVSLRSGNTQSCGCLQLDTVTTHGMYQDKTYSSWNQMIDRCCNPKSKDYFKYGGRGIRICERWRYSFQNFYEDMGKRPIGTTIDRYPNNETGNYEPSNCRWATPKEQAANRRTNVWITYLGKKMLISHWARELNIDNSTFSKYCKKHSPYEAINHYAGEN